MELGVRVIEINQFENRIGMEIPLFLSDIRLYGAWPRELTHHPVKA
jgi:hypothetical protein